ncbi:MAG TPA: hypothetical protein VM031_04980 [Phycisphaerae bacterium]|nr:hypothetical protein [Phycisphaerae bacterium]
MTAAVVLAAVMAAHGQSVRGPQEPAPSGKDLLRELRGGESAPQRPAERPAPASRPATASAPASQPATQPAERRGAFGTAAHAAGKLWLYFGLVGVGSAAACVGVWCILVVWAVRTKGMPASLGASILVGLGVVWLHALPDVGEVAGLLIWPPILAVLAVLLLWAAIRREVPVAFGALVLALAAFGLGMWNSDNVSAIREDRSAEIAAARARQEEARRAEAARPEGAAADIHSAEDDANAATRPAGGKKGPAAASQPGYAYRQAGRQTRDPNQVADANAEALTKAVADQARRDAAATPVARTLPGAELILANQLDLINRFFVRWTLVVALLAAVVEYLRRFNATFGSILPLPIACRAIDSLWPKTHTVHLHDPQGLAVVEYLRTAVQKGESFLCFAPADPWPGSDRLPRWPIGWFQPLRKIACEPGDPAYGARLLFESAWYGRYCVVLRTPGFTEATGAFLADVLELLRMRRHTRASAARTLNLAWAVPEPLPRALLEKLAFLCKETNVKLVVASAEPAGPDAADLFEELCTI